MGAAAVLWPGGAVTPQVPEGPARPEPERSELTVVPPLGEPVAPPAAPTWEEVVELHSARVYRLAYRLTGNKHDAEDLTQDVFVRVFRSLADYTPGNFEGWLHRITTNLFLDGARRKQRIRFEGAVRRRLGPVGQQGARAWRSPTPCGPGTTTSRRRSESLSPEFRAAVVLCDVEGLSYEEIAATLGIKLGTVRSRIHRGRAQLRAALEHRAPANRRPEGEA